MTNGDDQDLRLRSVALQNASSILVARQRADRRNEAFLIEAQRLSHTGSFGWNVSTGKIVWSEETFVIFGVDRTTTPTVDLVLQRVHPEDVARVRVKVEEVSQGGEDFDLDGRLLLPDGAVKHVHVAAHAVRDEAGRVEFVGAVMDLTEQHRVNAALESALHEITRSQHRLRLVIDTIPGMVWSGLPDGTVDFVNQALLTYLGLTWEEVTAQGGIVSVVHPDDVEESLARWTEMRATGKHRDHELQMRRADGQYRWFLARALPLCDEAGAIIRWYGTATNIDDRKRAELLLAGEKRLLEMIARGEPLARSLDALCRLVEDLTPGSQSSILLLEPHTNRLRHGAAPSLPRSYCEAIDGIVIGPTVGSCGTAAYRNESVIVSDIARDPLWADCRDLALGCGLRACWSTPTRSSQGTVLGTFAIYYREPRSPSAEEHTLIEQVTDLASIAIERGRSGEALREQASLLDLTHDTIFVRDLNDVITYWNRGAEELYGWKRHEAVGRVTHELLQTVFPAPLAAIMEELLETGRWSGELVHTKRDGSRALVASRWSLRRDERLEPIAVLETNNDITDRRRAEDALGKAQGELAHVARVTTLGEMATSIAHEVDQPLSGVVINANACLRFLAGAAPNVEEVRDGLRAIVRDGRRASDVIARIRTLARRRATEKATLDINQIIREVVVLAEAEGRRAHAWVRTELAADLPRVFGDAVQLQQVVLNLLLNGLDAMNSVADRPREVVISTQRDAADRVRVAVRDSGCGIDPEFASRMFDAFYTTKRDGLGMGLSISRSIVEQHGGRLWAAPNDGPGATFYFLV